MTASFRDNEGRPASGRPSPLPDTRPPMTEALAALVFLAIAAVGMISLLNNEYLELGEMGTDPGPGFVPWIALWALGLGGAGLLVVTGVKAWRAGGLRPSGEFTVNCLWVPALLMASLILYQEALAPLGFLGASVAFAAVWVAVIHWRSGEAFRPRHALQLPFEGLLVAGTVYVLFRHGIQVPLP